MYRAELHNSLFKPWIEIVPIRVGPVPTGAGSPGIYVTVEHDETPFARIDVWPLSPGPFTQALVWKNFVFLGWNDQVHIVDLISRNVKSIECEGYFGGVYPADDHLLIADAHRLIKINERGELIWESVTVGIDGVVVDGVRDGEILGQGEWDPPGGWRPFRLSLESGQLTTR